MSALSSVIVLDLSNGVRACLVCVCVQWNWLLWLLYLVITWH